MFLQFQNELSMSRSCAQRSNHSQGLSYWSSKFPVAVTIPSYCCTPRFITFLIWLLDSLSLWSLYPSQFSYRPPVSLIPSSHTPRCFARNR